MMKFKYIGLFILGIIFSPNLLLAQSETDTTKENRQEKFDFSEVVNGVVVDALSGEPIHGAAINYLNLSSDISDSLGQFQLFIPNYQVTIRVEEPSHQPKEIALKGKNFLKIRLMTGSLNSYYNKVSLPFRDISKSNTAINVSGINNNDKWSSISKTPGEFLQGKIGGLNVISRSGFPGIGAKLLLRGISSLYATNTPLIVVDGVIQNISSLGHSLISGYYLSPLSFINTRDIDNVTVIKNGTALYGSKGANGVILIHTTRGEQEATKIDVGLYGAFHFKPEFIPMMNAKDYRIYLSDLLRTNNKLTNNAINNMPFLNSNKNNPYYYQFHQKNNWQNLVFRNSFSQNAYLRITGGDNIAKYALSIDYLNKDGIIKNTGLTRYTTRFNTDVQLSEKLKVSANFSFSDKENRLKNTGRSLKTNPIYNALAKAPFLSGYELSQSGVASPILSGVDSFGVSNPIAIIDKMIAKNRGYRFSGSANFYYKLNNEFSANAIIGITMDKIRESFFVPDAGILGDTLESAIGENRAGAQSLRRFDTYGELRINYQNVINGVHNISMNLGVRYVSWTGEGDFGLAYNTPTDEYVDVQYGNKGLQQIGGTIGQSKWMDTYINLNYDYLKKYFLTFNTSIDGSSKFGNYASGGPVMNLGGMNYPVFSSLSAAWILSSEEFMSNLSWVNFLKLRGNIGFSGNDDIGNFASVKYYSSKGFLNAEGLVRGNINNPTLQWESVQKINGGIDLSLFDGVINMSLDIYKNKTKYLLAPQPAPIAGGMKYVMDNSGKMSTNGWDATFSTRIFNRKNFKWNIGFNVSHYHSMVESLPVDRIVTKYAGATIVTMPGNVPNLFYGFLANGVFTSDTKAAKTGLGDRKADGSVVPFGGGDMHFADLNDDGVIDSKDRTVLGDPNPSYFGGIINHINWKNWSLSMLISFSAGNDIYNYLRRDLESMSGYINQTQATIKRWRVDGQKTDVPRAVWGDPMGNSRFSSRWIEDGSYLRIKSLSLGFNVPVKSAVLRYIKVYATADNLLTLSNYLGYDPESSLSSNIFYQGVGLFTVPHYRSVQLGVRLGL